MKKSVLLLFSLMLLGATTLYAQKFPALDASPMDKASFNSDAGSVAVIYSRPQLKERSLEKLAPMDKIWRTGANEATTIYFSKDATIGGQSIAAGTYSLFTIPGKDQWTIVLNSVANQWGAYNYSADMDVLRVSAEATTDKESIEAFTMAFKKDGTLVMAWSTTRVSVPISF